MSSPSPIHPLPPASAPFPVCLQLATSTSPAGQSSSRHACREASSCLRLKDSQDHVDVDGIAINQDSYYNCSHLYVNDDCCMEQGLE